MNEAPHVGAFNLDQIADGEGAPYHDHDAGNHVGKHLLRRQADCE